MGQWPYIIACYAVTFGGLFALSVMCMVGMKRAEKRADEISRKP